MDTDMAPDLWGDDARRYKHFLVEVSPLVYFGSSEDMVMELYLKYMGAVNGWDRDGHKLTLSFESEDRAQRMLMNQQKAGSLYPAEPSARAIYSSDKINLMPWSLTTINKATAVMAARKQERLAHWPPLPPESVHPSQSRNATNNRLRVLLNESQATPSSSRVAGTNSRLMSRYRATPLEFMQLVERRITQFRSTGALAALELTLQLQALLSRHLAYEQPTAFRIPLASTHLSRELFVWIAKGIHVNPTSLLARGAFDVEHFTWSNGREEYEIVLDDLNLEESDFSG
jgi:hypothetical protein